MTESRASEAAAHRRREMELSFPDATVTGYDALIASMTNDSKDRHVLAAAVRAGTELIVTNNLVDFPGDALSPYNIKAKTADDFFLDLLAFDVHLVCDAIHAMARAKKHPPITLLDTLERLDKSAPNFAQAVRMILEC